MRASEIDEWEWVTSTGLLLLVAGTGTILYAGARPGAPVSGFGWALLFAGIVQAAHATYVRAWSGFLLYLFDGLVRAAVGTWLMVYASPSAEEATLALSFYLFAAGIFRTAGAAALEFPGWEWTAASGLVSVAVASMLALQWPARSSFFVGFAAGFDLILYGWALVMYATAARRLVPAYARRWRKP